MGTIVVIKLQECLGCQVANGVKVPLGGFLYEDDLWTVNHTLPPASILGWLVLQPKRHIEALNELTFQEQQKMSQLMINLDKTLHILLSPKKVYICMFAESQQCPHIHFHIIPRIQEIEALGPKIFDYQPQFPLLEEDILQFIVQAKSCIEQLMEKSLLEGV